MTNSVADQRSEIVSKREAYSAPQQDAFYPSPAFPSGIEQPVLGRLSICAVVVWGIILVIGFGLLDSYRMTPGAVGETPLQGPSDDDTQTSQGRMTLKMFVHPHCSCTRPAFVELDKVIRAASQAVIVEIVLVKPHGIEDGWQAGKNARAAVDLPGVRVRYDHGGETARRHGVTTSGHVILYSADDKLLFSGGITRFRGHEGEGIGTRALATLLQGQEPEVSSAPVFGCPLMAIAEND